MMHGKSQATANLAWPNVHRIDAPDICRLHFLPEVDEEAILSELAATLRHFPCAAVFIEPLQGSGGGYQASPRFYEAAATLCRDKETLLVFDEILTGFHRTGPLFCYSELSFVPDVVLIGKALGNGFPVAGVVARRDIPIEPSMLPGSTFAGNPLAAAAVVGTLRRLKELDLPALVSRIEAIVQTELAGLAAAGANVRGRGALWIVELPAAVEVQPLVTRLYQRGVAVGAAGGCLRLLPPAIIAPERLTLACRIVAEEVLRDCRPNA
jgi:acetylornithine/succinyldiaminopimelate/putrescine aminotransferase